MKGTCQVLFVEGTPGEAALILRLLNGSPELRLQTRWAASVHEAIQELRSRSFDGVLVDLDSAGSAGPEALTRLRQSSFRAPIIAIAGAADDELAGWALAHGAQDCLRKETLTSEGLCRAVRYAAERHRLLRKVASAQSLLSKKNHRLARLYDTAHQFVDNVSHEFRTPLTVIKEYAALVREGVAGAVSDEQRQMLQIVEDRADDLNTMVDDMLDVSKLEAGLLTIHRQRGCVQRIVERVRPTLERKAAVKRVQLDFEFAEESDVYCDAEKAGRTLVNLAINAIKFCGEPGIVRVGCQPTPGSPGATISVSDNGPGISAENQRLLFRRFQQVGETLKSSTKGFGLGLCIAKELAELNLGELTLDTELGRGSTFSFTLPPADSVEVMRRYLDRHEHLEGPAAQLSLLHATPRRAIDSQLAEECGEILSFQLRSSDLLLAGTEGCWLIALPLPQTEAARFQEQIELAIAEANRNRVGAALPELDLEHCGTWRVARSRREILEFLAGVCRPEEVDCV